VTKNSLHHNLTLASASPRRRELLRYLTPDFTVVSTQGEDEHRFLPAERADLLPPFPLPVDQHPTLLAWRKATTAIEDGARGIVLGADTIVVIDHAVLNKPRDHAEARAMLSRLAGRVHTVYTGVVALDSTDRIAPQFAIDAAQVHMSPLSSAQIGEYVTTGEPMDKAGAYGIQGLGGRLVERVVGSYTCVVGLPLGLTHSVLASMGLKLLADPVAAFDRWLADHGRTTPPCTAP
jgi:septum formation protein